MVETADLTGAREEPDDDGGSETEETIFILCRSRDRSKKEQAMVRRSEEKIDSSLKL